MDREPEPGTRAEAAARRPALDPAAFAAVEGALLGAEPHLTRRQVLERAGVSAERADRLWLSLGFSPPSSDDEVRFTDDDVEALGTLTSLVDSGVVDPATEYALTRSMGRSFSRLAEWEIAEIGAHALGDLSDVDAPVLEEFVAQMLPMVERLQNYVWRRHLASAAGRLLLEAVAEEGAVQMATGFADIVGFTRRSRSLDPGELAAMVEAFENTVTQVIADHGGRVIKTIGDEVMFVADDPVAAGRIALRLADGHVLDEEFPEVRVGVAYGPVLRRLGDVFGEVVNIASRLTSLARPGRVLVDRSLADELRPLAQEFRVRRARTTAVKGYSRLDTWALKRPKPPRPEGGRTRERPQEALGHLADRLPLPRTH